MSKDVSGQILNSWPLLTKEVRLKDISGILIQKRVMSPSEWEELKGKDCGEAVRMEEFLLKLTRRSAAVRGQFLLALKDGPYAHVYKQVTKGTNSVADSDGDAISKLQREVNKLMLHSTQVRDEKLVKDKDITQLNHKVLEMQEIVSRIPRLETDVTTLQNQLQKKRKEIRNLKKENDQLRRQNTDLLAQTEVLTLSNRTRSNTCISLPQSERYDPETSTEDTEQEDEVVSPRKVRTRRYDMSRLQGEVHVMEKELEERKKELEERKKEVEERQIEVKETQNGQESLKNVTRKSVTCVIS